MAVLNATISLIASFADGRNVTEDAFVRPLRASVGDRVIRVESNKGEWRSARVEFMNRRADEFRDADEPSEAFARDIADTLAFVARWIDERRTELLRIHAAGLGVVLLLNLFIDQDQMDWLLPPALLRAAGAAEIPIQTITND